MHGALLWGLVAGSAFVIGGLIALRDTVSQRALGLLMGFGAGALIAAVSFELVDEAGRLAGGSGRVAIGLLVGSLLFLVTSGAWPRTSEDRGRIGAEGRRRSSCRKPSSSSAASSPGTASARR